MRNINLTLNSRLEHIKNELEKNDKDHASFVHEMNMTNANLTNYQGSYS